VKIAIDVMSGDNGLEAAIPAVGLVLSKYNNLEITLVGIASQIQQSLKKHNIHHESIRIVNASEVVKMTDSPIQALRYKKDSSMRKAIDLLKQGEVDACVSAGNTGALMATSKFVLNTINGIDRPAIASTIPTFKGQTLLLDLGANVQCSALNLHQFALMGSILSRYTNNNGSGEQKPRVALLNVGKEDYKGNDLVKATSELLSKNDQLNYIGYIEGDDLYYGVAEVVVCDGFVGNIVLKTSEGVARFISDIIKQEYNKNIFTKLLGFLSNPVIGSIRNKLDSRKYNGASFLGLNGVVIKSHGGADAYAFANAIIKAKNEVEFNIIEKLKEQSDAFLSSEK